MCSQDRLDIKRNVRFYTKNIFHRFNPTTMLEKSIPTNVIMTYMFLMATKMIAFLVIF